MAEPAAVRLLNWFNWPMCLDRLGAYLAAA
jgi:hypothetical protein